MKKIYFFLLLFIFISNCSLKKVENHHGSLFLDKKRQALTVNKTNKNDILLLLGPPSTKSTFNNNTWIYIERINSKSKITKLGRKELILNDVLVLEFNNKGLLAEKIFLNKDNLNNIKFDETETTIDYTKKSFITKLLSGLKDKINDPLGKKRIKNK